MTLMQKMVLMAANINNITPAWHTEAKIEKSHHSIQTNKKIGTEFACITAPLTSHE
jgi:hypothetical protein